MARADLIVLMIFPCLPHDLDQERQSIYWRVTVINLIRTLDTLQQSIYWSTWHNNTIILIEIFWSMNLLHSIVLNPC